MDVNKWWPYIEQRQKEISGRRYTSPDQLSWGDTLLNVAAAIILIGNDMRSGKSSEIGLKSASTLFHLDTIEELVRLSLILNATEGFEDKSIVHAAESLDGDAHVDGAMSPDDLRRLFDR